MTDCCFFFSSRRRHTRWPRDWSSDVCSSDLAMSPLPDPKSSSFHGKRTETSLLFEFLPVPIPKFAGRFEVKIGRASCRERVEMSVEVVTLKGRRATRLWTSGRRKVAHDTTQP